MDGRWGLNRIKLRLVGTLMVVLIILLDRQNHSFCSALNAEGLVLLRFRERLEEDPFGALLNWDEKDGDTDPCSWFGVECSDGRVVVLHLKDLCLKGTLAPELGRLDQLKFIILRNNSFFGYIPKEIGELKGLEVLDLGYNNFSGPFPSEFANNLSLTTLLLDNNKFLGSLSPELDELKVLSEVQADENQLRASCNSGNIPWKIAQWGNLGQRMLLQAPNAPSSHRSSSSKAHHSNLEPSSSSPLFPPIQSPLPSSLAPSDFRSLSPSFSSSPSPSISESPSFSAAESPTSIPLSPSPSPTLVPAPSSAAPRNPPVIGFAPPQRYGVPMAPGPGPGQMADNGSEAKHHIIIIAGVVGGSVLVLVSAIGFIFFRSNKVVTVRPWATGLSGQLQKAFVTGVPKLKRSELEAACEDFSNIIGSFLGGTVYKGTLSSGVEIAVTSAVVKSREDWSKNLEAQFRKKIDTLSKVNHKNFVNLIGYCEEDDPFTRMMVFEYASNGTLFEHLHIKEAEHLDWGMRVRIAMGMAYCLDHMHQLAPPIIHENLRSSSICLTEDYAAKISDFSFWNDATAPKIDSTSMGLLEARSASLATNTYSFGVILFEMLTGRMPCVVDDGSLADWVSGYLRGEQSLREIVDPTLKTFVEDELEKLLEVVKICIHPDLKERPTMREIVVKLREATSMGPDGALPKLSPVWWAELEIMSAEGS